MSDPAGGLQVALTDHVKIDAGVVTAFGAKPVKIYDVVPDNAKEPYLAMGDDDVLELEADGLGLNETECTVHVWSRTEPPGKAQAKTIGAAVLVALTTLPSFAGFAVKAVVHVRSRYLMDPDNVTAHGVVTVRVTTEQV